MAILAGRPQAAWADSQPQSEKGQGVETHDDYGVIFGPPPGADNTKWLVALQQWRQKRRAELAYDGSEYNRPELGWARQSFVQALMIVEERYCYDRAANKYTVDRYLDDLEARYGGIDSVLIWPVSANMGIDNRNQHDLLHDMPGGMPAVARMVADFHRRRVRVLFPVMHWDVGTRPEDIALPLAAVRDMKAIGADGIYGDAIRGLGRDYRTACDGAKAPLVLEPECERRDSSMVAWNAMSWGYWPQPRIPAVSKDKWLEPRHTVHVCQRWARDRSDELQAAFFNGAGYVSWENIWGIWNGLTPRDAEALRRVAMIERAMADLLVSPEWQPHYPTLQAAAGVYASRFPGRRETLWLLVNRSGHEATGAQFTAPAGSGTRFYDLWHGVQLQPVSGTTATLAFEIEGRGYGAVLAVEDDALPKEARALLTQMARRSQTRLAELSAQWRALPQQIVEIPPTAPAQKAPEGMVLVRGGKFRFKVSGVEVEGGDEPGVDVQYPWEDLPRRHHDKELEVRSFYMDRYEVTNAQFKRFLDATGYRPRDDHNFLKDWKGGSYPQGWDRKPVTWVAIEDARAYAAWAGKRLPHEWEWQYAAQGGDGRPYPWGLQADPAALPNRESGRNPRPPTNVDAYPKGASPWGIMDMVGNVWQWTDEYADEHTRGAVVRGGGYYRSTAAMSWAAPWYFPQNPRLDQHGKYFIMAPSRDRSAMIGFRCVVDAAAVLHDGGLPRKPARILGCVEVSCAGQPVKNRSWTACGFTLLADRQGPQVAVMKPPGAIAVCGRAGENIEVSVPITSVAGPFSVSARVDLLSGGSAKVGLSLDAQTPLHVVEATRALALNAEGQESNGASILHMRTVAESGEVVVRWRDLHVVAAGVALPVAMPLAGDSLRCPPPEQPALRPAMERVLIEWDWRMQDGIDTERLAVSYAAAIERLLQQGDGLLADLRAKGVALTDEARRWAELRSQWKRLSAQVGTTDDAWEALWRQVHLLRRQIVLSNPVANTGPIVFAKHVAGGLFSHQLTQYQGDNARPGGGIFVLQEPGRSMRTRQLAAGALPQGAFMSPEVSFDGRRVLFSYCKVDSDPPRRGQFLERHFHLYQVDAAGSDLRQLTDGAYDDFSPRCLPDGKIIFISTRRGGYHRCGAGPCPVYTLALCEADGSNPRAISYHETHEWDPAVLNDGRVIYTRWDYVDRDAVHFEHLWTVRPDGSGVRAFYGNNTLNPIGIWEARPIPGVPLVMATAAAHHAMTAGAIILLDVTKGVEDLAPITRFTPDVPFPESESPAGSMGDFTEAQRKALRWPGHCYRSPYPLSETCCLAAYSYDSLVGEPRANRPNMFGLYCVDRFGNKELLYRDLNLSSVWPAPLRPRPLPPRIPSVLEATDKPEGRFFLRNVYESWVPLPKETIAGLRIIQVLPKTTPNANNPMPGLAGTSPGKQVLGTVPVERDGSAYFRAPARIPLQFQALDSQGRAVQMMYSIVYLQPGETASCAGCHERKSAALPADSLAPAEALRRPPSGITPGPDGSKPLSFPLLVQPVLDRRCVSCHNASAPKEKSGGVFLTGAKGKGPFSESYDVLAPYVPYSAWSHRPTARTYPDQFGARASKLMKQLLAGHHEVRLLKDDLDRLTTWMDANALFYGTFNPKDQQRQFKGERITGPDLE